MPVGDAEQYGEALPRSPFALLGGVRWLLLRRVTMDACVFGAGGGVEVGDEVVVLGKQDGEGVFAEELGRLAGTINYEITTGVNPRRVERSYTDVRGS